jgi:hypothetical protein
MDRGHLGVMPGEIMSRVSHDPAQTHRRIAILEPARAVDERVTHALQLLNYVLWAYRGLTYSMWEVSPIETADVLVFHEGEPDERIVQWTAQGRPVVEIAIRDRVDSDVPNLLVYPFRAAQVLKLLDRLEAQLTSGEDVSRSTTAEAGAPNEDPWSFVEGLRTLRAVQNKEAWLIGREARTALLWLRGDAATYSAEPSTVQAIRRGSLNPNRLILHKGVAPSDGQAPRSGMELSWFAGYYASDRLAPALKPAAAYRITSWPNFGLIRPLPSQIRVLAGLTSASAHLAEIASRSGISSEEAARTLNALHACGVLVEVGGDPAGSNDSAPNRTQADTPQPPGGLAKFLSHLRRHLGLGSTP